MLMTSNQSEVETAFINSPNASASFLALLKSPTVTVEVTVASDFLLKALPN